jgi:hypothetical protein
MLNHSIFLFFLYDDETARANLLLKISFTDEFLTYLLFKIFLVYTEILKD